MKLHQEFALQRGQGADKGDIFKSQQGDENTTSCLEIFGLFLEKHNERNSKEHSLYLGVAFAFCASEKKPPREEIEPRLPE